MDEYTYFEQFRGDSDTDELLLAWVRLAGEGDRYWRYVYPGGKRVFGVAPSTNFSIDWEDAGADE